MVNLTNPDKVLYPETGTTKRDVFDYYTEIAPYLLPHLAGRPVTRRVWPNGVEKPMFYAKDTSKGAPAWLHTVEIQHLKSVKDYVLLDSVAALEWDAQTAGLEIHVPQWRMDKGEQLPPDRMVIDLDPGEGAGLPECARVALLIHPIITDMGLELYPVTSGSKGIHLYAPLTGKGNLTSDDVSAMAKELAKALEEVHPDLVISTMSKASRKGKVMVDWSQNNAKKTTITPYSLRGIAYPNAVAPRTWDEIASPDLRQLSYAEVLERAHKLGDLISGLLPTTTMTKGAVATESSGSITDRPSGVVASRPTDIVEEVHKEAAKSKRSPQADTVAHRTPTTTPSERPATSASRKAAGHFEPMLASMPTKAELARLAQDGISEHPEWDFEMKWDGFRALASVTADATGTRQVKLASRGGKDFTERFPELQAIAEHITGPLPVVLDGEIVALRDNQPSFRDLQSHSIPVTYEAFDILQVGDEILLSEPLTKRRELLEQTLTPAPPVVDISPELPYLDAMTIADRYQLEGVMAKRAASPYQPGVRSKDWEKI
ncbi:MAG: non-homologous end-joining DNA ligase, partial [Promicromonosporaceae bacterium]|nr:non-homologous end-joining DNA ligase [Promicromonosporaceae bacterium]